MGSFDPERELEQTAYLLEMKAWQAASHLARAGNAGLLSSTPCPAGARAGGFCPPASSLQPLLQGAAGAAGDQGPRTVPAQRTEAGACHLHSRDLLNLGNRQAPRVPGQPRLREAGSLAGCHTASGQPDSVHMLMLEKSPLLLGTEIPP